MNLGLVYRYYYNVSEFTDIICEDCEYRYEIEKYEVSTALHTSPSLKLEKFAKDEKSPCLILQ